MGVTQRKRKHAICRGLAGRILGSDGLRFVIHSVVICTLQSQYLGNLRSCSGEPSPEHAILLHHLLSPRVLICKTDGSSAHSCCPISSLQNEHAEVPALFFLLKVKFHSFNKHHLKFFWKKKNGANFRLSGRAHIEVSCTSEKDSQTGMANARRAQLCHTNTGYN